MAAKLLFERGRPGNELETEAVVDHGEAAGGEREALAVGTSDVFAAPRALEELAGFGCEFLAERFHFPVAQRVDQVAVEGDARAGAFGKAPFDQMLGATLHRLLHLGAEAAFGESDGRAGDILPVQPSGAGRRDLMVDVEIGANSQRDAALSACVVEFAQFYDGTRCAIARRLEVWQPDVMGAAVYAIDHGIGRGIEFVV